jgi:hypothetical protein
MKFPSVEKISPRCKRVVFLPIDDVGGSLQGSFFLQSSKVVSFTRVNTEILTIEVQGG